MIETASPLLLVPAALLATLGAVVLAGRLARRSGLLPSLRTASRLRVSETIALDSRNRLHLVTCDGHDFLLATGAATVGAPVRLLPEQALPPRPVAERAA